MRKQLTEELIDEKLELESKVKQRQKYLKQRGCSPSTIQEMDVDEDEMSDGRYLVVPWHESTLDNFHNHLSHTIFYPSPDTEETSTKSTALKVGHSVVTPTGEVRGLGSCIQ